MKKILFLFILLTIIFIHNPAYAAKNALPQEIRSFTINLDRTEKNIIFDPNYPNPITLSSERPLKNNLGNFTIFLKDISGNTVYTENIDIPFGKSLVYLPYFLNNRGLGISYLERSYSFDLSSFALCNEDAQCNFMEEFSTACPKDCANAKNPLYPRSPYFFTENEIELPSLFQESQFLQELLTPSFVNSSSPLTEKIFIPSYTTSTARRATASNLWLLGGAIIALVAVLMGISWYNKK